ARPCHRGRIAARRSAAAVAAGLASRAPGTARRYRRPGAGAVTIQLCRPALARIRQRLSRPAGAIAARRPGDSVADDTQERRLAGPDARLRTDPARYRLA